MFGFLNVYKPKGMTSHDVVAVLRRITKIKQIGHTGTLDPFAEGVLPVCIGKATRLIEYLKDDKAYVSTIQLGKSTTTYDIEGETVNSSDKKVSSEEIETALKDFEGEIEQTPPIYSAIKVKGKKLYEYARKELDVEIPKRKVTIHKIDLLNYDKEKRLLKLYVACSKGTYIRSIANDIGIKMGVYGHLVELVRVQAGNFLLENSVKLDQLQSFEDLENNIINPLDCLDYPKCEINEKEYESISHGMPIEIKNEDNFVILTYNQKIAAVGNVSGGVFKCNKVFL